MRHFTLLAAMALLLFWLADCSTSHKPATAAAPPAHPGGPPAMNDANAADRAKYIEKVKKSIAGKENMQADSVFHNLKALNKMPAERLLNIMDHWGGALGVSCDHCHATSDWASDVKPEKNVARQMMKLTQDTNEELRKITGLKSERPGLGCMTCHHGEARPGHMGK